MRAAIIALMLMFGSQAGAECGYTPLHQFVGQGQNYYFNQWGNFWVDSN